MKQLKCELCGFEAGYFTHDIFSGKLICIECENRIYLVKHREKSAHEVRDKLQECVGKQTKFPWYE